MGWSSLRWIRWVKSFARPKSYLSMLMVPGAWTGCQCICSGIVLVPQDDICFQSRFWSMFSSWLSVVVGELVKWPKWKVLISVGVLGPQCQRYNFALGRSPGMTWLVPGLWQRAVKWSFWLRKWLLTELAEIEFAGSYDQSVIRISAESLCPGCFHWTRPKFAQYVNTSSFNKNVNFEVFSYFMFLLKAVSNELMLMQVTADPVLIFQ